jgi:RHS repeat-associated protein
VQWFYYQNGIANPATGDLRTDFRYDGLGRLRQRLEYLYNAPTNLLLFAGWNPQSTNEYLYDGWRVLQERDGSNVPLVSYTRGNDLSGTLEGAGGIGGLLARSSGYSSGNWTSHAYYHADGNGNITCLINASQSVVARYRYDPFGNTLSQSGTLAVANVYRFSSKEIHTNSLMYYYGYRFYDPGLQRWLNREPIEEEGDYNLYRFVKNDPEVWIDPAGQDAVTIGPVTIPLPGHLEPGEKCGEAAHEKQHRCDFLSGLPGWQKEQRGFAAEAAALKKYIANLEAQGNLTPAQRKDLQAAQNELGVAESIAADPNSAIDYWNDACRRWYQKPVPHVPKPTGPLPTKPPTKKTK